MGDLRIIPDVRRVVPLAGQPGWAWSPGERYQQSGEPHAQCSRLLLGRLTETLARARARRMRATFEIEWVISAGVRRRVRPGRAGARATAWPG